MCNLGSLLLYSCFSSYFCLLVFWGFFCSFLSGVWSHPNKNGLIQAHKQTKIKLAKGTVIGHCCLKCMLGKPCICVCWLCILPGYHFFGRIRFIAWCLRHPFLGECQQAQGIFETGCILELRLVPGPLH